MDLKRLVALRREEYLQRIPIEGKFGQGKHGYRLSYIRAKRSDTSAAWIIPGDEPADPAKGILLALEKGAHWGARRALNAH